MTSLLLIIGPIALLDSTSMIPLSIVPIALILANRNPVACAIGFLLGILLTYFSGGLLLLYGLDALLERIEPSLQRWMSNPSSAELLLQFIVGLVLLVVAHKVGKSQGKPGERATDSGLSPTRWLTFSAALTLGGLPGAVPYIGAIDQIIRAELSNGSAIAALAFYNFVFLAPLALIFVLPRLFPSQSEALFARLTRFFEKYGPITIASILAVLGLVFAIDAVGFFFGHPLLPVQGQGGS